MKVKLYKKSLGAKTQTNGGSKQDWQMWLRSAIPGDRRTLFLIIKVKIFSLWEQTKNKTKGLN